MAMNEQELLRVYRDLHKIFPEDLHIARPLVHMLQQMDEVDNACDLALTMARRMLAQGNAGSATGFLELCKQLCTDQKDEIESLSTLARMTANGPVGMEPSEAKVFQLIDQLSDQEAMDFLQKGRLAEVEAGADIVKQGEVGSNFYLILEGEMRVVMDSPTGQHISLGTLTPGNFFGEFACVYKLPRSATVTASMGSLVLEFSDLIVSQLMQRSPIAGDSLMRTIQMRLVQAMSLSHPALDGLPEADRRWVAEESELLEFQDGATIAQQGRMGDNCYVVVYGDAEACLTKEGESLCAPLATGDMFGDLSAYLRFPGETVVTSRGRCLICRVPKRIFQSFLNAYGGFEHWVKNHAVERLKHWRVAAEEKAASERES